MPTAYREAAQLDELAPGVYAYVQPDGGWNVSNSGIVVSGGETLLIDTVSTIPRGQMLQAAVRRIAPGPPRALVNTHHHGDHTFSNHLFAPEAVVIAHEQARVEMAAAGLGLRRLWPEVEWGEVAVTLPSVTFRDRLDIHIAETRVELSHVGPAHTTNDVVAWLPAHRILFTGDVVMSGVTPFCLMGSIRGSLAAVDRLRSLGPRTLVCGHGPVTGREAFDVTESYLRWVWRLAQEGLRAGLAPAEVAREADLGEFARLLDRERLVGNLHRAYAELRGAPPGAPLDVLGIFDEMVEQHGGLPYSAA